ncbi:UNVERIFIED_CONTAM: AAA family ATPase [Campylobacter lari]
MKNLANELRPKTLSEVIGQKEVIKLLKEIVKNKIYASFIFFGESGTGKSSTAFALAKDMQLKYSYFNAAVDSKSTLTKVLEENEIIIIDEIHRLNKDKQDILLSYLEFDKIIVYATTTENPYFRVNPALRSRMQIKQFKKLSEYEMFEGIKMNLKLHFQNIKMSDDVIKHFVKLSNGDYRSSLNHLQMISLLKKEGEITKEIISEFIPHMTFYSDENSSAHYNNLSAFHKSLRGSDIDAAFYYGALILKTGDYQGLFRRMLCCAYEDVGLADPTLPVKVKTALDTYEVLGMPEGNLPIFNAIALIALAPKSNSVYEAINYVNSCIDSGNVYEIPKHLRDSHYASAIKLQDGVGYKYPHDFKNHFVMQQYLPNEIKNTKFFKPQPFDNRKVVDYYQTIQK